MKSLRRIGPIEAIEIPGDGGGPFIFVFHGYGADARDLLPLARLIQVPPGSTWYFCQGPLKIVDPLVQGHGWFPFDAKKWIEMGRHGERDLSQSTPEGLKVARENVFKMLAAANTPVEKSVFMGFSQGSFLACDVALRAPVAPMAMVLFASSLLNEDLWREKAKARKGLPFFQSHGTRDELLGIGQARKLEKLLVDAGLVGHLHEFDGGHEIPQEVIYELNRFFKKIFERAQNPGH